MFTIDLLKGEGIPVKSRPESMATAAAAFTVPITVAIVILGIYLSNSVAISIQKQRIVNYETKIDELSEAVRLQQSLENEQNAINSSLSEVKSSIGRHAQWSPILATLVRNLPDSMVLTKLEVKQHFIKRKVAGSGLQKTTDITVPVRTLQMTVSGSPGHNCERAVRDFRDRLHSSALLGPNLEDIRVSQEVGTLGGQNVVSYEIECIFKPDL